MFARSCLRFQSCISARSESKSSDHLPGPSRWEPSQDGGQKAGLFGERKKKQNKSKLLAQEMSYTKYI